MQVAMRVMVDGDLGSSVELDRMHGIGELARISITGLTATDGAEIVHCRFADDVTGELRFTGFRFDAADGHPIEEVTLTDIRYTFIGGVKLADIPPLDDYPRLVDKLAEPDVTVDGERLPIGA